MVAGIDMAARTNPNRSNVSIGDTPNKKKGMVLPFQPLSLAFDHINYYVDMPAVSHLI